MIRLILGSLPGSALLLSPLRSPPLGLSPGSVSGSNQRAIMTLLALLFARLVRRALAGGLVVRCHVLPPVGDNADRFFPRGIASGNVEELLGRSRASASQFVHQRLACGPR